MVLQVDVGLLDCKNTVLGCLRSISRNTVKETMFDDVIWVEIIKNDYFGGFGGFWTSIGLFEGHLLVTTRNGFGVTTILETYRIDDLWHDNLGQFWESGHEFHSTMENHKNTSLDTIYDANWVKNSEHIFKGAVCQIPGF